MNIQEDSLYVAGDSDRGSGGRARETHLLATVRERPSEFSRLVLHHVNNILQVHN